MARRHADPKATATHSQGLYLSFWSQPPATATTNAIPTYSAHGKIPLSGHGSTVSGRHPSLRIRKCSLNTTKTTTPAIKSAHITTRARGHHAGANDARTLIRRLTQRRVWYDARAAAITPTAAILEV